MIGSTRNVQVYALAEPCDLRLGYDGLYAKARDKIGRDPNSGHLFLFVSRTRKRAKVLLWDGTGLAIYMKRLEQGRFAAPWERCASGLSVQMTMSELALFLEGSRSVMRTSPSPKAFIMRPILIQHASVPSKNLP